MSIDKNTVAKIARLARIQVSEQDQESFAQELTGILKMVEELNAVDTTGIEPLTSVVQMGLPLRADGVSDGGMADKILANAPETAAGFFVVPKVVE